MARFAYGFPDPQTLEQVDAIRFFRVTVDLEEQTVLIDWRLYDGDQVRQAGRANVPLAQWDSFVRNAGAFPGDTFEAKLHTAAIARQIVPRVPEGGSTVDLDGR